MTPLKLDMTVPIGDAGHVHLDIAITDLAALSAEQRQVLADTAREFCEFGAAVIAPPLAMSDGAEVLARPEAKIHDPDIAVLDGVLGSRIREKL